MKSKLVIRSPTHPTQSRRQSRTPAYSQEVTNKTQALGSQTTVSALAHTIRTCRAC